MVAGGNSINVIISAATSGFTSAIHNVQSSLGQLQSACSSAMSGVSSALGSVHGALSSFSSSLHSGITSVSSSITSVSAKLFPVLEVAKNIGSVISGVVSPLIDFGSSALKASADMETMKAGLEFNFEKQLGDPAAAKEKVDLLVNSMQQIGEMSAYDSGQLLPMARSWVNIGDSAETAIAKMQTITDTASAYGLSTEAMERANLALTQMQMKGKMQAEEMMQLTEAGIPAWTLLSQAMGLPVQQLQDMASKGQLTQEAMAALFTGMQEQCGGSAASMAETLSGKFANIREAAENSLSTIGDLISQGLDVPGVLGTLGDLTGNFKEHLGNIAENAKEVGVGQAITDELESMGLPGVASFVGNVIEKFQQIWTMIETMLFPAIERLGGGFDAAGGIGSEVFDMLILIVEVFIICLTGIIDIINIIIRAFGALHDFQQWVWNSVANAISELCSWMTKTFGESFAWIENAWNVLREILSDPIDVIVNIIWHDTKDGTSTEGNKITKSDNQIKPHKFSLDDFGGGSSGETFGGSSGGGGGRSGGGGSRGGGGGGGRGSQKEAPWEGRKDYIAEVEKETAEMVQAAIDTAEKEALKGKNVLDPILESFKDDKLGKTLKDVYTAASKEATKTQKITSKIMSIGKNKDTDAYGKILKEAENEIKAVGEQMLEFRKYQAKVNEEADKYGEKGEKTLQHLEQREATLKRIADLEEKIVKGKADDDTQAQLDRAREKLVTQDLKYAQEKKKAETERATVNQAAPEAEQASKDKIAEIEAGTKEKLYSREAQLEQANDQLKKANMATELDQYIAMMNEKGEYADQSYAKILANEEALNAQRQVWHEQLMLNAMEWADFMSMTFANLNQQLIDGLSSGLAECIVQGKTLGEVLQNLAANLLQTLINNVMKKWLTSLIGIGAQSKANAAAEVANSHATIAAESAKSGAIASNAIGAYIAARPFMAESAAPTVLGQMSMGKTAFFAYKADGGLITGAGTSTSDSIPAMLSNGEFVMRAEAVNRLGTSTLYALNEGKTFHYSDGGQVGTGSAGTAAVSSPSVTLNVSAMDASGFESFLLQGGLDTIRQALFDNNRNFGAAAGVF